MRFGLAALSWYVGNDGVPINFGDSPARYREIDKMHHSDLEEVLDLAQKKKVDFLLLPGYTRFFTEIDKKASVPKMVDWVVRKLRKRKLTAMFEIAGWYNEDISLLSTADFLKVTKKSTVATHGATFLYDAETDTVSEPFRQNIYFSKIANSPEGMGQTRDLLDEFAKGGSRILNKNGLNIGLMLCGESNILRNIQADGNRVELRLNGRAVPTPKQWQQYDVLLHQVHVNMGNMGKMFRRWEYLSQRGKWCLVTMNNMNYGWKSAMYVFHDGKLVLDGESKGVKRPKEHDNWRFATLDIP